MLVIDNAGMKFSHMSNYSMGWCRKMTTIFQEMYPARPKKMHFLNMPNFVNFLFNLVRKYLMKKKIQERMMVHSRGDYSKLIEDLGAEVLPEEFGGTNKSLAELTGGLHNMTYNALYFVVPYLQ